MKISSSVLPALLALSVLCGAAQTAHTQTFCRALGDSLTDGYVDKATNTPVNYSAFLQTMGRCSYVSNEGVSGQISTEIAVRSGALPTTATIVGGVIPALRSVEIHFPPGHEATTHFSGFGVPMSISGVAGIVNHVGSTDMFSRSTPGMPVASAPDSPVTILTGPLNNGFVIIWAGKNNYYRPQEVLSDIAAMVAFLPNPKRFVVLSITNSNVKDQWKGGKLYDTNMQLNASLAAAYPRNFLDIRSILVAGFDPNNAEDVIDHGHDVLPFSLRLNQTSTLPAPVPDAASCTAIPAQFGMGSTVQIDDEKIYVLGAGKGFANDRGCIRGYAGTIAATHSAGAPVLAVDATHLDAAGHKLVAKSINDWMTANGQ